MFLVAGESVWALRCISAFSGTLTVGAVYLFAAGKGNRVAGIIAATLCALSPFHIAYSQEGRPYALAAFLALLSCHFFFTLLEKPNRRSMMAYLLTTIALLYTHHWGLFVAIAQFAAWLLAVGFQKPRITPKPFLVAVGILILLYIPEIPALRHQSSAGGSGVWWWSEAPSANEALELSGAFSGTHFNMAASVFDSPFALQVIGAVALGIILGVGMYGFFRAGYDQSFKRIAVISSSALVIPLALSFFRPEVFLWYRHTLILFPLLCVAIGMATLIPRLGKAVVVCSGILILLGAHGAWSYSSWSKSNIRDAAMYMEEVTRDEPIILIRPAYVAPLLNYYYSGSAVQLDEAYLDTPLGMIVDTARSFVYVSLDVPNEIRNYMNGHFDKTAERVFPGTAHMGLIVGVYRQKPDEDEEPEGVK